MPSATTMRAATVAAVKAATSTKASAAMKSAATAGHTSAESCETTRSAHHSGSGMEAGPCRSRSAVNTVGIIGASYVVSARTPITTIRAEMVVVVSVAISVSVSTIPVPIERSSVYPPG